MSGAPVISLTRCTTGSSALQMTSSALPEPYNSISKQHSSQHRLVAVWTATAGHQQLHNYMQQALWQNMPDTGLLPMRTIAFITFITNERAGSSVDRTRTRGP